MHVAVDIRHLTHPQLSGVGHYTLHVLRALSRIGGNTRFTLFASGSSATLARLPVLPGNRMRLVQKHIPNRALFALLKTPGGPTLESFLPEQPDCWWFPDSNIIRTKLPYILTVHDLAPEIFPQFFTYKDRARYLVAHVPTLARNASVLLAVSQATKNDIMQRWRIAPERIVVTPLGVGAQYTPHPAPSDRNYQLGYGLTTPYFLCLATNEPRKNLESVIEAYSAFRSVSTHAPRLVIAGGKGWRTQTLQRTYQQSAYRHDIVFTGYVHEKHKPALYRGAQAFLFPSYYEGFGLPVLEAIACGTPVVTSFTSALPEVAGDAAVYVDPLNVHDLTSALQQLVDAPDAHNLRALLRARGVQHAKAFSWERTAQQTLSAFQ